uniref:Uncharacterized protein n=1 Tax=Anopheles dirus TaxID=7168 RepID=A0A182NC22_9DIPT
MPKITATRKVSKRGYLFVAPWDWDFSNPVYRTKCDPRHQQTLTGIVFEPDSACCLFITSSPPQLSRAAVAGGNLTATSSRTARRTTAGRVGQPFLRVNCTVAVLDRFRARVSSPSLVSTYPPETVADSADSLSGSAIRWFQLSMPDADGDPALIETRTTCPPGSGQTPSGVAFRSRAPISPSSGVSLLAGD